MISKTHRADSVPRPVPTRLPAAGTARHMARRTSSAAFRPPARPTVVHLPGPKGIWRRVMVAGMLGVCALSLAWWVSHRPEQRHAVAVDYPRPAEDIEQTLARQIPAPEELPPVSLAALAPAVEKSVIHLDKGDTLTDLLTDLDLERAVVVRAVAALRPLLDIRRLQAGQAVHVTLERSAEAPILRDLTIRPEPRRQVTLERGEGGVYRATEKVFDILKQVTQVAGLIKDSLIESAQKAGLPRGALNDMLHAFAWDVSFQHDLKAGDRFAALVEQAFTEDGKRVGAGRLLWARLTTGGGSESFSVYRFQPRAGRDFFYTPEGESVVRALLRTPLDLARLTVSSAFGKRRHPLLGFTRMHEGVDFPAPRGTPVLAAGDGRIVQAGRNGGYGNWVKIVHSRALATGYAHLQRIARGIRAGVRVRQNQVIGFVGSTGLSTGPHLHFELRRNGMPVDPLSVTQRALRTRLAGAELARFLEVVSAFDRLRGAR